MPTPGAPLLWVCSVRMSRDERDSRFSSHRCLRRQIKPRSFHNHHLILDTIVFLTLRTIKGSSTSCVAFPDPLIFFLSLRLQAVLKDPEAQQTTVPVRIRREKKVVVALVLQSATHPLSHWGWEAIEIPETGSVKPTQHTFSGKHLKLSAQVLRCSSPTGVPDVKPCGNCWKRERRTRGLNQNLEPYMIDFQAEGRVLALSRPSYGDDKCLKVEVTFHFTCYSKHHGGLSG